MKKYFHNLWKILFGDGLKTSVKNMRELTTACRVSYQFSAFYEKPLHNIFSQESVDQNSARIYVFFVWYVYIILTALNREFRL